MGQDEGGGGARIQSPSASEALLARAHPLRGDAPAATVTTAAARVEGSAQDITENDSMYASRVEKEEDGDSVRGETSVMWEEDNGRACKELSFPHNRDETGTDGVKTPVVIDLGVARVVQSAAWTEDKKENEVGTTVHDEVESISRNAVEMCASKEVGSKALLNLDEIKDDTGETN